MELKSQYEDALSGAKDESRRMIEQARADAKKEYDRILKDADARGGKDHADRPEKPLTWKENRHSDR